jgi:uncharacterized protein YbbK (DUF523 family)
VSDTPKIFGLDGKPVEPVNEKQEQYKAEVVDLIEQILEKARSGQVDGVAILWTEPTADKQHLYQSSWQGPRITLMGAMARAMYAMNADLDKHDVGNIFPKP